MFDWFREVAEELSGIDSAAARRERVEKQDKRKQEYYIFSRGMKVMVIVLGLLYVFMAGATIAVLKNVTGSLIHILRYSLMAMVALFIVFSLVFGKKRGEIFALVGIAVFVVALFFSTVFLI